MSNYADIVADRGIALLGASGRSGKAILRACASRGIPVSALTRNGSLDFAHPSLRVVKGDARDLSALSALLEGRTAVVSALGRRPGEPPLFAESAKAIIQAMRARGVGRYVGLTGLSLVLPGDRYSLSTRLQAAILRAMYRDTLADRDSGAKAIMESGLEWTLLRLPRIDPDLPARGYSIDPGKSMGGIAGTADIAAAVLDVLYGASYIGKAPFVSSHK